MPDLDIVGWNYEPTKRRLGIATRNGRSLNIRAPMPVIKAVWEKVYEGEEFEWIAYKSLGIVVLRKKER